MIRRRTWPILILFAVWLLIYWGDFRETSFGMDAMTYGGISRHMAVNGDWKIPIIPAKPTQIFFQHPPFLFWLTALSFKWFGINEVVGRFIPTLFALGTAAIAWIWAEWITASVVGGFAAGFILLTSSRFIKYTGTLLLDGTLTFWIGLGALCLLAAANAIQRNDRKRGFALSFGVGICFGMGFLTKGVFAGEILALSAIYFLYGIFWGRQSAKAWVFSGIFCILGACAVFGAWFSFLGGAHFFQEYWDESVARHAYQEWWRHFGLFGNLLKTYWPWFPLLIFGCVKAGHQLWREVSGRFSLSPRSAAFILVLIHILGLVKIGFFLEHHMVPFYLFAAVLGGTWIAPHIARHFKKIIISLAAIECIYALALLVFPLHVQGEGYHDDTSLILKQAAQHCSHVNRINISTRVHGLYLGIAYGSWNTPWDTVVTDEGGIDLRNKDILLLTDDHPAHWQTTGIEMGGMSILEPEGASHCRR